MSECRHGEQIYQPSRDADLTTSAVGCYCRDILKTWQINEIAITMAYGMLKKDDPVAAAGHLVVRGTFCTYCS